ncbi:MAG: hypothetical protein NT049_01080, partial [Planctomycetota bacterium]|nr:hypothetical protein [Planctomycetota bacterium]
MKRFAHMSLVLAMAAMVLTLAAGCVPETRTGPAAGPVAVKAPPDCPANLTLVMPTGTAPASLSDAHFVTSWLLLGPFTFKEGDFGGDQQQASADKEFMPNEGA